MNAWAHPIHHNSSIAVRTSTQRRNQVLHWLQWDAPHSPPKLPLPLRRSPPKSNTPFPRLTHLPPQTASGSNQPFCHNSLLWTDRWGRWMFCTSIALLAVLIESDVLIIFYNICCLLVTFCAWHRLQCFDTVGWSAGRASGLLILSGEVLAWL